MRAKYSLDSEFCSKLPVWECDLGGGLSSYSQAIFMTFLLNKASNPMCISNPMKYGSWEGQSKFKFHYWYMCLHSIILWTASLKAPSPLLLWVWLRPPEASALDFLDSSGSGKINPLRSPAPPLSSSISGKISKGRKHLQEVKTKANFWMLR